MRRLRFMAARALSLTAMLLMVAAPALSSLHLAACHHDHLCCCLHATDHHQCECSRHDGDARGALVPSHPAGRAPAGRKHDPSTCPICRAVAALSHGVWFSAWQSPPVGAEPCLSVPSPGRPAPDPSHVASGYPRAPPAC